jgi:hypothetical protein
VTPLQLFRLFSAYTLFAGGTADNLSGTYSRTGTTVTVTATAHGHLIGHRVYLDFTTGTAVDGAFTVTTVAARWMRLNPAASVPQSRG